MGRFILDLTDDDRAALEAMRKNRGLRSHAEVVRELIRQASSSGLPAPEVRAAIKAEAIRRQSVSGSEPAVPVLGSFERKPYQKKAK